MTNNHARNQRKAQRNIVRRTERQMEREENLWAPEPEWPVPEQRGSETLGAQGGHGTADEGTAAVVEGEATEVPPRRIRKARTRRRGGAAALSTVADSADNQGLPGSVMATDHVEAGQGLQEAADAFRRDPRVVSIEEHHQRQLAALEEDVASRDAAAEGREASIKKLEAELEECKELLRKERNALQTESTFNGDNVVALVQAQRELKQYRDQHEETIKAAPSVAVALAEAKKSLADMSSELQDSMTAYEELVVDRDALAADAAELQGVNERLEAEAADNKATIATSAATKRSLDDEIAKFHTDFEQAFSDMAKDLTVDQKFAYVREQQEQYILAARLAESTLHDELEKSHDAPPEILSLSKITSVETSPVAAVKAKKPFALSKISSVDTPSVAPVAGAKKPLGFSKNSSVDFAPVPAPARAARQSMSLSGVTSVETVPVAAVVAAPAVSKRKPLSFSGTTSVEIAPVAAPVAATSASALKKPLSFSGTTCVNTAPAAASPALAGTTESKRPLAADSSPKEPSKPKEITKIVNVYSDRYVDRAVVPWWMWLLLLLGLLTCFGGFAGLWREQQIWVAANETAYHRLMGASQETWLSWIIMGVKDLIPPLWPSGTGHSLFV